MVMRWSYKRSIRTITARAPIWSSCSDRSTVTVNDKCVVLSQTFLFAESAIDSYRNRRLQHPDKAALVPYILGGRRYVCVLESERVLLCRKSFLRELGGSEWILQVSLAHPDRLRAKKRSARSCLADISAIPSFGTSL